MNMKPQTVLLFVFVLLIKYATAQISPQVPKNLPRQPQKLPTPRIHLLKPDLQFVSVSVSGVHEDATRHLFEITLSITYKNAGAVATPKRFFLDLQNRFEGRSGGYQYTIVGAPAYLQVMTAGQQRTGQWTFAKDESQLGRGRREFIIRIDCNNNIAESNEENNNSPVFSIDIP